MNSQGLKLLSERNLEHFCDQFPNKENIQEEWRAVITHEGKYVNLHVGQKSDEDVRERLTRRTIATMKSGSRSRRTTSWPTMRLRHMHVGLSQGLMKRSTIIGSG